MRRKHEEQQKMNAEISEKIMAIEKDMKDLKEFYAEAIVELRR